MAVRTSPRCSHPVRDACRDTSTTNDKGSKLNVLKDQEFSKSRQVLLAKKKQLVEESAKGNRPRAARELFEEEEDLLFTSGEFGDGSPEALQRTVWWLLSMQFGFRARDESRKLKWGDINLITDGTTGNEFLVWIGERGSKTCHGDGSRGFNPTAQATNNERYPVEYYKSFKSHRPEEMLKPDSPFFLAVNHRRKPENKIWYCKSPLGRMKSASSWSRLQNERVSQETSQTIH